MTYKALYRKYRPTRFEDVVGQDYIIKTLRQTIKQNKIGHAYLFCGTRGTGKTSVAKLFAKTINCLNPNEAPCNVCDNCVASDNNVNQDIVELDAASNNSVDDIRDIIEQLKYVPFQSKYKVYIIDEVHMLSGSAFNALLKSLEEPPQHVVFILATTEPNKVLPTIISRCQRFDFLRVDKQSIIKRLKYVADKEGIDISTQALIMISELAEGGMRDALSILDQCVAYTGENSKIDEDTIKEIYGLTSIQDKINLVDLIHKKQAKDVLDNLKEFLTRGIDFKRLTNDFINIFKESILYSYTNNEEVLEYLDKKQANQVLEKYSDSNLLDMIDILMKASESYFNAVNIYNYFEVACLKLMNIKGKQVEHSLEYEEKEIIKKEEPIEYDDIEAIEYEDIEVIDYEDTEVIEYKEDETIEETQELQQLTENYYEEVNEEDLEEEPIEEVERKKEITNESLELFLDEEKEEVIDNSREYYDNETLLRLVVQCDRDTRSKDEEKFKDLIKYRYDLNLARYVNLLSKTQIAASGEDCILLVNAHEAIVNEINDKTVNIELYKFIKENLDIDKMVFGLTEDQYKEILNLFTQKVATGTLPNPYKVNRYKIKKEKEIKPIDRVIDLFGLENVEIIEEE